MALAFERYCGEIVLQAGLLAAVLDGADGRTPVPTCPGWTLRTVVRHVGVAHRWAETIVRTGASEPPPTVRHDAPDDLAGHAAWLLDGAGRLAETLRNAGPDRPVWTWAGPGASAYWARRMTFETVVHRADAFLANGADFTVDAAVAADGIDELFDFLTLPFVLGDPRKKELLGPGRTVHLHATDTEAEWLLDLTGKTITWRPDHAKAAVAVRAPVTDLFLTTYRRLPADNEAVQVLGDAAFYHFWYDRLTFG
ncbi:maleylpyruvate isomerase family mycothiol-dependent enzyme [Actinomadura flavalba]|uniref:maleylpyruvate isomerase family mycothiol-dependent enzyme n=1 Tax=Actinomadura flavalba TaxID=1120938 RepID=UPI000476C0BF|nr:maleylpyruvate isomerase family mycothiol-dependent enzyme [Actinomadura flavalba]